MRKVNFSDLIAKKSSSEDELFLKLSVVRVDVALDSTSSCDFGTVRKNERRGLLDAVSGRLVRILFGEDLRIGDPSLIEILRGDPAVRACRRRKQQQLTISSRLRLGLHRIRFRGFLFCRRALTGIQVFVLMDNSVGNELREKRQNQRKILQLSWEQNSSVSHYGTLNLQLSWEQIRISFMIPPMSQEKYITSCLESKARI